MVKIRLTRTGRKNLPTYRVVAIHSRSKNDGKVVEYLGNYSSVTKNFEVAKDRVEYWLSVGAQPSPTVTRLLVKQGIMDKKSLPTQKFNIKPGQKSIDRATKKAEAAEAAKTPKQESQPEQPAAEAASEEVVEAKEEEVVAEVEAAATPETEAKSA